MIRKIILGLAIVVGLAIAGFALFAPNFFITIPEQTVRSEIDTSLPRTETLLGATVVVDQLVVDFRDDNTIHVSAEFSFDGYTLAGTGETDVVSGLRYENGNFYLRDFSLDNLAIELDTESSAKAEGYRAIGQSLFDRGVSMLGGEDADSQSQQAARELLESARETGLEKAKVAINTSLTRIPVYSLNGKDIRYDLAALALEDVTFSDTEATAELNPARALRHLLFMGLVIVLSGFAALGWMMSHSRH